MNKIKKWMLAAILTICGTITPLTSFSNDDNQKEQQHEYTGVPLIIMDTDIGSSTDDLLAMMMLYRYQERDKCRLLGIVVDREGEDYAACADVMNTYYGHDDVPIGLIRNGIKNPAVWIDYRALPTHADSDGQQMFRRSLTDYSALPDGWQLYRQLLAAQPDGSVSIVSTGFVTCLAQLLQSAPDDYSPLNGVELVRRKVKCIYLMGGVFGDAIEPIEYNFAQGVSSAQTFFQLWPDDVDVIMSPGEVGDGIDYRPEQVIADIDWTDAHPIKQVYMKYDCDTGQRMWDPLTVFNAVEGDSLFVLSPRGNVTVSDKGETFFTPSPTGNVRYHLPRDATWNADMLERIRTFNKMR
ncbi:MAG: nucleoside hydrolase [Bacteroidaceae bacterium]|nr:nucleoside hydrolase [Bacteroidaceae bacterium]